MSLLLQHFLHRSARLFPDVVAVDVGDQKITYRGLEQLVYKYCSRLLDAGIPSGRHVAIFSNNSIDYVACYFACAHLGAVLVPLNAHLQSAELEWIIGDCDPVAVIADSEFIPRLHNLTGVGLENRLRFLCNATNDGEAEMCARASGWLLLDNTGSGPDVPESDLVLNHRVKASMEPEAIASKDQLLIQMYTSGTTGTPKGVMLSHENITSILMAWLHEMPLVAAESRFMQATPLFHVGGMLVCMCSLAAGATLLLLPRFDAALALNTLHKKAVTHTLLVPSMIQQLLLLPDMEKLSFPALQTMIYGASSMPQAIMSRAIKTFACGFLQGYGLTETAGVATSLRPVDHRFPHGDPMPSRLGSAGRELLCCEIRVVDENMKDVAVDEMGEIVIRGANVTKGYWNNAKATAEAIVNGWLKTGDLGRFDQQGYLYVVDRLKDMIDVSGENVYPAEVEGVLSGHTQVKEVAVIGLPNLLLGQEVVAIVAANTEEALSREQQRALSKSLKHFCSERLAAYKCPVRYKYIDALPRTPAGKIKKQILRQRYSERYEVES